MAKAHGGNIRGWTKYNGRSYRSLWEANLARYLDFLKKHGRIHDWGYEVDEFEFPVKRGNRFYKTDFKVWKTPEKIEYWELKGYMDKDSRVKLNRMKKYYPEVKIIVVDEALYKALARDGRKYIPGWE